MAVLEKLNNIPETVRFLIFHNRITMHFPVVELTIPTVCLSDRL